MTNKVIMRVKVNDDPDSHKDSDDNCPDNDNPHHNNHSKKLMMMTTTNQLNTLITLIITYGAKLLNADWLRQRAFFS